MTLFSLSVSAFADCGPKYSVTVKITGIENAKEYYGETYYATLLSKNVTTGPASAFIESRHFADEVAERYNDEIWGAFQSYRDADGYYYLQEQWELTGDDVFCWGYYPPDEFKLLLYFPETGGYMVSEPQERYAFNAYFTANIRDGKMSVSTGKGTVDFFAELAALLIRAAVTVGLEILVALAFGYRGKRPLRLILIVNIATQLLLNIALNIANFKGGILTAAIFYVLLEAAVFVTEAVIYAVLLPAGTEKKTKKGRAVLYAFTANLCSFIIGGILTAFLFSISDIFMYV